MNKSLLICSRFFPRPRLKQDPTDQLSCGLYYIYYTIKFSNRGDRNCQKCSMIVVIVAHLYTIVVKLYHNICRQWHNGRFHCSFLILFCLLQPPNLRVVQYILGAIQQMNSRFRESVVISIFHSQNGELCQSWLKSPFCKSIIVPTKGFM